MTRIINKLNNTYGGIIPLSISRGKIHTYLGMTFDYTNPGKSMITMCNYIDGIISNADDIYNTREGSATPAPEHLYEIREPNDDDNQLLDKHEKERYHTITVQCLYPLKGGRPDIQQSVAFHCTRVNHPTMDDQKKLAHTIKYLMATVHIPLILSINKNNVSEWWADASFAIHDDMCSRTGAVFSMGKGAVHSASTKKRSRLQAR